MMQLLDLKPDFKLIPAECPALPENAQRLLSRLSCLPL
jgi:hypothetical protein